MMLKYPTRGKINNMVGGNVTHTTTLRINTIKEDAIGREQGRS